MPPRKSKSSDEPRPKLPPVTTPEARESQLVAATYDLAEQQILDGTASAQVISHFLKLGTVSAKLELKKIELENKLLEARTSAIGDEARQKEQLDRAIHFFTAYKGEDMPLVEDDDVY
jgi:hypothetical protein